MSRTTYKKDNRLDRLLRQVVPIENAERGQMLLIMAMAMVGLLVAVGLAVDGGVLFARKAQLDRATDAAALVGVVEYANPTVATEPLHSAHTRARQFLGANGIIVSDETDGCTAVDWNVYDFCGEVPSDAGSIPGTTRYRIEVRWESEVYFMGLIGFDKIPLRSRATAEYFPLVDIFTSPTAENGLIRVTNLSIFGPRGCAKNGDPRTPVHTAASTSFPPDMNPEVDYNKLKGVYTYRITVPASFYEAIPEGEGFTQLRIELFDPDSGNQLHEDQTGSLGYQLYDENGIPEPTLSDCEDQGAPFNNLQINSCLIETDPLNPDPLAGNPFWIVRVDESRDKFGNQSPTDYCTRFQQLTGYDDGRILNTVTLFRLYYYQQTESGTLEEVDLAYYIGKPDPSGGTGGAAPITVNPIPGGPPFGTEYISTDLMWVSPGSPDIAPLFDALQDNPVVPGSPLVSAQEPTVNVEPCDAARQWIRGTGITAPSLPTSIPIRAPIPDIVKAEFCSPTTDGNFTVNLPNNTNPEVPDIFVDPNTGSFDIFLQVMGINGSSENGFDIWAGPTSSELGNPDHNDPHPDVPANVNARNVYYMYYESDNPHSSHGVTLTGLGHLNMNYNSEDPADLPLAYLGPQFAGANMTVSLFDPDGGEGPIVFYMDSIPQSDWVACFEEDEDPTGCDAYFADMGETPPFGYFMGTTPYPMEGGAIGGDNTNGRFLNFDFTLPGDTVPFYGGRLIVYYNGAANDTLNWSIIIESRPLLIE